MKNVMLNNVQSNFCDTLIIITFGCTLEQFEKEITHNFVA